MWRDPKEHDWRSGAFLLDKALKSRAAAAVGGDLCGERIRNLLISICTAEFVAVKPGMNEFDYADHMLVKAGTSEIVASDYKGKTGCSAPFHAANSRTGCHPLGRRMFGPCRRGRLA
jgi:hypothetical protein